MLDCAKVRSRTGYYSINYAMVVLPALLTAYVGLVYCVLRIIGTIGKTRIIPKSPIFNDAVTQRQTSMDVAFCIIQVLSVTSALACLRGSTPLPPPACFVLSFVIRRSCKVPSASFRAGRLPMGPARCDKLHTWTAIPLKPQTPASLLTSPW
jgi:hypothetical protein